MVSRDLGQLIPTLQPGNKVAFRGTMGSNVGAHSARGGRLTGARLLDASAAVSLMPNWLQRAGDCAEHRCIALEPFQLALTESPPCPLQRSSVFELPSSDNMQTRLFQGRHQTPNPHAANGPSDMGAAARETETLSPPACNLRPRM